MTQVSNFYHNLIIGAGTMIIASLGKLLRGYSQTFDGPYIIDDGLVREHDTCQVSNLSLCLTRETVSLTVYNCNNAGR